jgi:peptide/nickel transport system substrate-binding protein
MRRTPRRIAALHALILLAVLTGCGSGKKEAQPENAAAVPDVPAYGDMIVEGSIGGISGFLSAVTSDAASHEAAGYVFNGLVRYDKDLKLEGELAKSWEVSPDGRKITFHLRKGVKWQDGAPFTSEDVMFTYRRMIDPRTPTAYAEDFKQVRRASAPDPHTFVVEYARSFAPALASWGMHVLPKHLLEKYPDISKSPLNKKPVGTGPYRFVEWKTGEKVVYDANPDYFEGKPYIARVITRVIPDQATMFLELRSTRGRPMPLISGPRSTNTSTWRRRTPTSASGCPTPSSRTAGSARRSPSRRTRRR